MKLQIINNSRSNLVTIVNNPSSFKERNASDLHNGICISDKTKYLFFPSTTIVNVTSIPPKIWHLKQIKTYIPTKIIVKLCNTHYHENPQHHSDIIPWCSSFSSNKNWTTISLSTPRPTTSLAGLSSK